MINLIKSKSLLLILFAFALINVVIINSASSNTSASETENNQRIYDKAGLLSTSEYEDLEQLCIEYGEDAGIDIYILTHNDSDSVYPEAYIENFEDTLPVGDRVYFLYDKYRGEIFIEGYGLAETYIHSKRIDLIFDQMMTDLRAKAFYDAFKTYISLSASYMKDDFEINEDHDYSYSSEYQSETEKSNYSNGSESYDYDSYYDEPRTPKEESILTNLWFQIIASLVIGAIVVGTMAYNSGGKMTVQGNNYIDPGHSGLIGRRDQYIRTRVTRVRKPTQNNNSGRGGFNAGGFRGGVSLGGRSHSSGGRKL
ncbi:TPM domain-containing protein [Mobilitalea sibirica]|uniref:TPM domain-containing protein n=1 Tax=Mobilitalea sibirica TaxID=1462919 RepID=A0A8J7H365_9FIRM|nr:TPM domain-containing protein [Mobilitalea sibirica]MBH1941205.1 TPM domain-containing protein [Mobilitalea sibirica]